MSGTDRLVRRGVIVVVLALCGALAGLIGGVLSPAHVEIAGSDTRIWLRPGRTVDQVAVTGVVTLTRATGRSVLGEAVGVRAVIDFDASQLVRNGTLNTDVVPAYVAAYSDPEQLISDMRHEFIWHLARWTIAGTVLALALVGGRIGYRRLRRRHDRGHDPDGRIRAAALAYRRPERVWSRRVAFALGVVVVLGAVPSAVAHPPRPRDITGNPVLADTPLADVEVSGLLSPALLAARDYIRTYAGQNDTYYDALRSALRQRLDASPVELPEADDAGQTVHFGFVTDRHCNTGMDRVTVALLKRLGVTTLVSGGDDAFSGTFAFEAACTRNLAQQSKRAGITDVMAAGNHDSQQTVDDERDQGVKVLERGDHGEPAIVEVDGLRFVGSPDPRTSRYGEGIRPASSDAQRRVLEKQAAAIAKLACDSSGPLIAVAHDPTVGTSALGNGCGHVTLALDGHTHAQAGPVGVALPGGVTGQQFTGGSAGGAPGEKAIDRTFASSLTVGPLHHDAFVYVVSVERDTGALVGIATFRFTPDQQIEITQLTP